MKIIFFGTPVFVIPVLQALVENFQVIGAVTTLSSTPSPVAEYAQKQGIPVFTLDKLDENLQADLIVLAAYGKLLPQKLLDIPKFGSLNIHPSLLPKYRGPSPIQSAILNGDKTSGVTIIQMDDKMDHGPIISAKDINISCQDNLDTLSKKMFSIGAELLTEIIPDFINGKITPKEQDHKQATFTKIIKKEDGYFNIENPPSPEKLDRMVRAYYPWPTAWTRWNNKIVKFYPRGVIHPDLIGVQMEGKKATKLEDFLRGYPNFPLKYF